MLKPEIAEERKNKILNWVVHNYVNTNVPVSSDVIASKGGFKISSATIRNILKELEEAGYLYQTHTSGGRIPTDKGYRMYVDYILNVQKMASTERERIEHEYDRRVEQLDTLLKQTSRILSNFSKWAGFVMPADIEDDCIKRIELVLIGNRNVLTLIFMHSGIIKHLSFTLEKNTNKKTIRVLESHINKALKDVPVKNVARIIWNELLNKLEVSDEIIKKIFDYFSSFKSTDMIYLDGLSKISEHLQEDSYEDFKNIVRVFEEKNKFCSMLKERLKECIEKHKKALEKKSKHIIEVTIGSENTIKEFKNFSVVSSSYCLKDKTVGLVGILGGKRMEYPRMISIVDAVSSAVEDILSEWETFRE